RSPRFSRLAIRLAAGAAALLNSFDSLKSFARLSDHALGQPSCWWTGEDSNLRSPQGAADLQSAGFSHSPTRPAKPFGTLQLRPVKSSGTQLHPAYRTQSD